VPRQRVESIATGSTNDRDHLVVGHGGLNLFELGQAHLPCRELAHHICATEIRNAEVRVVELVSGDELCDLLKQYELGVVTKKRTVEEVELRPDFFAQFT
jgi:restriction endonuclease Mrr